MTIDFCEVGLAVILCSVITVLLYMASWYKHEENQVRVARGLSGIDDFLAGRRRESQAAQLVEHARLGERSTRLTTPSI